MSALIFFQISIRPCEIYCAVPACLSGEAHTNSILHSQCSGEITWLSEMILSKTNKQQQQQISINTNKKQCHCWLAVDGYELHCFKFGMMVDTG